MTKSIMKHLSRIALPIGMALIERKYRRPLILSIPYIGVLCLAHVAGEVMGVIRGPGQSPHFVD